MNKNQKLIVYKANKVVEAGYKLTLNEQRVILACIAQVDSKEKLLITDEFELSAKDFAKLFNISEDRSYSELQEVAKTLYQRSLTIHNPNPNRPKLKKLETRWISSIGYIPDDGKIVLRFAQEILPYLSELKGQFTRYDIEYISKMTCIYGIRLYELLAQWDGLGTREIEIDWLKKQFEIEDQYSAMCDFKKRVLDPAVKDINTHSNYEVSWTQRKTGRKVTHLTFEFSEKKPIEPLKKPRTKTKAAKQPATEVNEIKIDNLDYFADMRKRYKGKFNEKSVPQDIIEQLKTQGRW